MAAQQNGPTEAALNCLSVLAKQLDKDTLKGVNWAQAAADAGMSSGRSCKFLGTEIDLLKCQSQDRTQDKG